MPPRLLASIDDFREAAARLRGVAARTPVVPLYGAHAPAGIHLKLETLQPIGSFKIRGVYNAVARLSDAARAAGISTVSAGNTAQALAWCGRRLNIPARSIMPDHAPQTKINAVRAFGGEPVLVPTEQVFRYLKERAWEREPYAFIHPWTNRDLIIGHGTMGIEIIEQFPDVNTVFIPVGGGGLMAGVGTALRALKPNMRIIAVEPSGCPSLYKSIDAGRPVSVECNTICDGVAVPYITDEMFPILGELADECVLVSDDDVKAAMRALATSNKVIAEPAGALAVAAASATPHEKRGPSVAIVTGGSIDPDKFAAILTGAS